MRTLYHWPLDPNSRQARLALAEKKIKFTLVAVTPWQPSEDFLCLCAEGVPPCLVDESENGKNIIASSRAICEYVDEIRNAHTQLLPPSIQERFEARRIAHWFDIKFSGDVNAYILSERLEKTLSAHGAPDPHTLRLGREHLKFHLEYITWLLEQRDWLAGKTLSLADIAAGAHLSCLDYLGEINWQNWPSVKSWYQKLKSRPSFRPLLKDKIPGLPPSAHYTDLDF
ncbi:MAG: glutathione S-transferase family protein [Robiginitomaculum sp.]|nr:glutathione S-transferase family protein [Robiginitomaculum sp.]